MRRLGSALALATVTLALAVPQAPAAVTVGMVAPTTPTPGTANPFDIVQESPAVTYLIPEGIASPVITSWSTNAAAGAGQQFALKVFRKIAQPAT